jgi:ADP-heptose:LPS heptosyltransferase
MRNGTPRILIIRLSAIGDVVRVLPALHALRDQYPKATIDWAVERKSAGVLERNPLIDRLVVFERGKGVIFDFLEFLQFLYEVRKGHYDVVIDYHGQFKSGLALAISGARKRLGFARPRARELSYLFTNEKVKLPAGNLNRLEENLLLTDPMAARRKSLDVTIEVPVDVQETINTYFEDTFDGGKWVVAMHPPVERPEKQWPLEYFARLADLLMADGRFEVLLTYGPNQMPVIEEVVSHMARKAHVAPETRDLKQYAWLAHRADLFFGGDTGPMHIASAMGTSVIVVFGGTDPAKHAPGREPSQVLYHDPGDGSKPSDLERLRAITPDMAYDACVKLVTNRK